MLPSQKAGGLFLKLGLLFTVILTLLVGAEQMLRLRHKFYPVQFGWVGQMQTRVSANFIPDAQTGWRMRPDHTILNALFDSSAQIYHSNSQGFRSDNEFEASDRR